MDSFTLQMHYKFTPGTLLLILLCIILFYNQGLFIIVGHADNLHDKGKIQTNWPRYKATVALYLQGNKLSHTF